MRCSCHESNLLYLIAEIALLCFLKRHGSFIDLTLSAVKHLGKDNNSQFYDTVGREQGCLLSF